MSFRSAPWLRGTTRKQRRTVILLLVFLACLGGGAIYYDGMSVHLLTAPTTITSINITETGRSEDSIATPAKSLTEIFQTNFPQCQIFLPLRESAKVTNTTTKKSIASMDTIADQWISWLNATWTEATNTKNSDANNDGRPVARYVPTTISPRYDHISCFLMKARYNCAMPPVQQGDDDNGNDHRQSKKQKQASDYQFLWQSSWHRDPCDVRQLVESLGGPTGISRYMMTDDHRRPRPRPYQVLLQGNSYLRQVWEALVCGFRHQMTNLTLLHHGPMTSLAYIRSRSGKLLSLQELGEFWTKDAQESASREGCHGPSGKTSMKEYYWNTAMSAHHTKFQSLFGFTSTLTQNVSVPPTLDKCTDDMAMVEFGRSIQFFFLFHPSRYSEEALVEAYQRLGIHTQLPSANEDARSSSASPLFVVDALVWASQSEAVLRGNLTVRDNGKNSTPTILSLERLLPFLKSTQESSLDGYFFGANNPWITHPPDNHPCMPGIPDDEANILLYLLLLEKFYKEKQDDDNPKA